MIFDIIFWWILGAVLMWVILIITAREGSDE